MDKRILIADNDEQSLTGLGTLLADLGYATYIARTLDDTLLAAARFTPDVAIVALSLLEDEPAILVRRLRDACGAHEPLLIALTGWPDSRRRDEVLAVGFDVHLVRPVGLDQLTFILSMIGG
ncbi:response regulator [Paraburkholderia acidipaludis]|uniref:response regulator n=1 Tax=Paraburkholderia acidipaludis TaxID=660537 RepID=UPI000483AB0D|nr:response regulator [Paraburkholderia acidipaludis]